MSEVNQQTSDIASMSDDEFLEALNNETVNASTTQEETSSGNEQETPEEENLEPNTSTSEDENGEGGEGEEENSDSNGSDEENSNTVETSGTEGEEDDGNTVINPLETDPVKKAEQAKKIQEPENKTEPKSEPKTEGSTDYKSFHDKVMAPFKANGKMIQLKSPEEAIQLMQQGANYTRKMQEIQPYRKAVMLLEKHGLLDEAKLSYLVDLDQKNPEAIKKLIQDSGIDPMDIDTNEGHNYVEGSNSLGNEEFEFRTVVQEVSSSPTGRDTIEAVTKWDQTSQDFLWKNPQVLNIIHQQKESGVYDLIVEEMERRQLLGQLSPNTPFIAGYEQVGKEMAAQEGATNSEVTSEPKVVATTVAKPKPTVTNSDKAKAASPTQTNKAKAPMVDIGAMSDDEFLNHFQGRI